MKLIAVFEVYDQYKVGPTRRITARGEDKIDCLKKLVDKMKINLDVEQMEDQIESDGATFEDFIHQIKVSNGDACDHILKLTDEDGNVYIDENVGYGVDEED